MIRRLIACLALAWACTGAFGQQLADPTFSFHNDRPSFPAGQGPTICIDEAHNNFHTADGRYRPFADLLRSDGFKVVGSDGKFAPQTLMSCRVMVIANAIAETNEQDWSYPHPSSFAKEELIHLVQWIRQGGGLLLFADHSPMPGAAGDLGYLIGLQMFDGYVSANPGQPLPDVFGLEDGTLKPHAILTGRPGDPPVQRVGTFTGQAFALSSEWTSLLTLADGATGVVRLAPTLPEIARSEWPRFRMSGWSQGAARLWAAGRIIALGEAAVCSAQTTGQGGKMGMNHPSADQNPQFCLNLVRWLTGGIP